MFQNTIRQLLPIFLVSCAFALAAQSASAQSVTIGQIFRDCPDCPEMVVVPSGKFTLGSARSEHDRSREEGPQTAVSLPLPFAVGRFEVTFAQWDACVADGGCSHRPDDKGWGRGDRPVINVSWNQVTSRYLPWLSAKTGHSYRLPSEAEWEYSARAGSSTAYWWGTNARGAWANCKGCDRRWGGDRTAPVGSFAANPFGLHDLSGNVFELTADCWNKSHNDAPDDGKARADGTCNRRVIKGGSWYTEAKWIRSAARMSDPIGYSNSNVGLRVVRSIRTDSGMAHAKPQDPDRPLLHLTDGTGAEGPCKYGLKWRKVDQGAGQGAARLESCGMQSPTLPIEFICSAGRNTVAVAVPMVQSLPRMLRGPFPVSLYAQGQGMQTADGRDIPDQIRQFQAMRQDGPGKGRLVFEIGEDDPLLQALALGREGYVNITGQTLSFHLDGARDALTAMRSACGLPKLNIAGASDRAAAPTEPEQPAPPRVAEGPREKLLRMLGKQAPQRARTAEADGCSGPEAELARLVRSVTVRAKHPASNGIPIGTPTTFGWSFNGQINEACHRPLYLVVTAPKRTRFEGIGFLAIPGGAPGPFDIKHDQDKTRLFFPLHLLDGKQGEFKVKSFEVGALDVSWALVQAKSKVANPRTKADFALGQEYVSDVVRLDNVARYTVGEPKIVVRDNFTLDKPKKIIRSNSGEFDLQVFDGFYRVLDALTGELVLERAGVDPNFSPGSRFVGAFVEGDSPAEVLDLHSRGAVYRGEAGFLAWGHEDAFLVPGEYIGSGAGKKSDTNLKVKQSLVDGSPHSFLGLEYYKSAAEDWRIAIDLEMAIVTIYDNRSSFSDADYVTAIYDISDPSVKYSYGTKAWRSLIRGDLSSASVVDEVHGEDSVCLRRARNGVIDDADTTCFARITATAERRLRQISTFGYVDSTDLFKAELKGAQRVFPWFINGNQLVLSHHCQRQGDGECNSQELASLTRAHRSVDVRRDRIGTVTDSESRLVQIRSAEHPTRSHIAQESQSEKAIYSRLSQLELEIASSGVGIKKTIVPRDDDWWDKVPSNVRKLKKYISSLSLAAAQAIPDGSVALSVEERRTGSCYTKEEYAGTAAQQQTLPSHRISESIELKSRSYQVWIFQPSCTNGAEARNSFWLLLSDLDRNAGPRAQLVDVSFDLRFKVGDQSSGRDADGTLQTHRELGNTLGFGSWPQTVDATAISEDRYLVANGTWPGGRWALVFDLETRKVKTFIGNVENADDFGALALTKDGRTLVQANTNGQLFFYDTTTGKVILRGVETDDELIIYDESGYYLSSPEGSQFLNLKFPGIPGYSSVAQFASTLDRPDAIKAILAGRPALPKPNLTAPPNLRISTAVSGKGNARQATLEYETASEVGLKELIIFVDGRPERRLPLSGERTTGRVTVGIAAEARWISAVTVDRSGYRSIARGQGLPNAAAPTSSRLFVISVGTDTYSDNRIDALKGAKRDAEQFAGLATLQKGKLYGDVEVIPLFDEPDLKGRLIARIRETVSKARVEDTIMMFAAGHGDRGADGRFYLLTGDSRLDALEQTSVSWIDIAEAFRGVKARVVIFLDACRSGAAGQSGTNDDAVAAILKEDVPITVIAASKGRQDSLETSAGGYFTRAILKAVYDDRAKTDSNGNGAIELAELYGVLKPSVVRSTGHKQTPWIARNQMVGEIPLF